MFTVFIRKYEKTGLSSSGRTRASLAFPSDEKDCVWELELGSLLGRLRLGVLVLGVHLRLH